MTRVSQLKEKEMKQQDFVLTTLQQKLVESLASHVPGAKAAHAWHEPLKQDQVSEQKWVHEGQAHHREQRAQDDEAQDWKWGERWDEAQEKRGEQRGEAQDEKWGEQRDKAQDEKWKQQHHQWREAADQRQQVEKQKWPADEKGQWLSWKWDEEQRAQKQKWPAGEWKHAQQWLRSGWGQEQRAQELKRPADRAESEWKEHADEHLQGSVDKAQRYACDTGESTRQARPQTLNVSERQRWHQEQAKVLEAAAKLHQYQARQATGQSDVWSG
ncbi:unnamed protein product [Prorocentrum cordatum]|uniref:Uncharacterized protein n=1 Tax=Prorocentrum cordatum TaxID=2364126 RepID=A0ABN9Y7M2_9DINO|nr:unnamed protein product [Polarella glacialis]